MPPKIKNARVLENYLLEIEFDNDVVKIMDFKLFFEAGRFESLREYGVFDSFEIDPGGYGISWNDEIDISENELWEKAKLAHHSPHS